MALIFVAGIYALSKLNTQFFPDFGVDIISIEVSWPGASAGDVEASIVEAIEPGLRFLGGVDRVTSHATEGVARVFVEYEAGTDMQAALSEADAALRRIAILPQDSERPVVRRILRYDTIVRLVLSGPYSEAVLKRQAKRMRDDLLAAGVDRVALFGARAEEILVEIEPRVLRQLDLTPAAVAARIEASNRDIPSGTLEGAVEKQLRSVGQRTTSRDLGSIEIRSLDDGHKVLLRDVASLSESFDDNEPIGVRDGRLAIELHVQRSASADALKAGRIVDRYLVEARGNYPPQLRVEPYDAQADLIRQRIDVLFGNGVAGLMLVIAVLLLFFNARTAFWVAAGIPTAFMAALATMLALGESINMLTLFALIMTLGLIVDDTIVVAEHAAARREAGMGPRQAGGGRRARHAGAGDGRLADNGDRVSSACRHGWRHRPDRRRHSAGGGCRRSCESHRVLPGASRPSAGVAEPPRRPAQFRDAALSMQASSDSVTICSSGSSGSAYAGATRR